MVGDSHPPPPIPESREHSPVLKHSLLPCAPPAGPMPAERRWAWRWVYPHLCSCQPASPALTSSPHLPNHSSPPQTHEAWRLPTNPWLEALCLSPLSAMWPKFLQASNQDSDIYHTPGHRPSVQASVGKPSENVLWWVWEQLAMENNKYGHAQPRFKEVITDNDCAMVCVSRCSINIYRLAFFSTQKRHSILPFPLIFSQYQWPSLKHFD